MTDVNRSAVVEIDSQRGRRMSRAVAARRRLERAPFPARERRERPRTGGRAWINGVELGGTDARHASLSLSYD